MAYDLKATLGRLQEGKRQNFVFLRGEDTDQVFISPTAPTPRQIKELEEECGSTSRMMKGVCYRQGDLIVFAIKAAVAPAWEKMLTTLFRERKCAQFLPISLRQLGPDESDEVSGDGAATPGGSALVSTSSIGSKEAWETYKGALIPQLRAALADPKTKEAVTKIISAAILKEKAGAFSDAIAIFERLSKVVTLTPPAPTAAPVSPTSFVPPPPAPSKATRPASPRQLIQGMNRLAPVIKRFVQENPARRLEVLRPVASFQQQLQEQDVNSARESLRQAGLVLRRPAAPGQG